MLKVVVNHTVLQLSQVCRKLPIYSKALSAMASTVVEHDSEQHRFYMRLSTGETALLDYEWIKDGVVNLYHTEVPVSHRGQGIAQHLAKAAFEHVVQKDAKMVLTCTYLEKYVKDNPLPEYTSRVIADGKL